MKTSLLAILGITIVAFSFINSNSIKSKGYIGDSRFKGNSFGLYSDVLPNGSFLQWEITDYNEEYIGEWWNANYTNFRGRFSAQNASLVNLTITTVQIQSDLSAYWGFLEFGNLSLTVDSAETGSSLALSIYPWLPGLVTHTNWTWHRSLAEQSAQGAFLKGDLSINEITYEIFELGRAAISFNYLQDKSMGNQNTTLVYDMETGILLSAQTEVLFGTLFRMSLKLRVGPADFHEKDTHTDSETEDVSSEFLGIAFLIPLIAIITFVVWRRILFHQISLGVKLKHS